MRFHNILQKVGNTPIVKLNKLKVKGAVEIWGKLESQNPGGSVKDRIALAMIEDAEKRGLLTPEKIVIEASSGNTGIGLAMVCAAKGYRCVIAMPESASLERRKVMQAFGAEIVLTPAGKGTDGAIEFVYDLVRAESEKYFCPDQFNNPANWQMHYRTTGPEIWAQTEGKVTFVVSALGTTGTAMGIARYALDNHLPFKVVGVEPYPGHKIQGLKNMKESFPPGIFDRKLLYKVINVCDEEAYEMARWLARNEGIFVGMSSGAALAGALKLAEEIAEGMIVVIFPDHGERYLSTPLWAFETKEVERDLYLYNTLTQKKEAFVPKDPPVVKIYTCGPTLNIRPHIGLYRRLLTADILKGYLKLFGYTPFHVVNLTDFDDKTIQTALEKERPLKELTEEIERAFYEDLEFLRIERANAYPRVSENLEEMKELAFKLYDQHKAYEKFSALYFDVSRFPDYGRLAKVDLKALKGGVTVDQEEYEKEEPYDFALLKRVHILEMKAGYFLETPIGRVRPTWHIHCACIALKYLGDNFDIYTSGRDLIFPHHENTRAVAKALTGKELANYWIHTELSYFEGKKLSSDNRITLPDIKEKGFEGRVLRLYMLQSHYSSPLNFSWKALEDAKRYLEKIDTYLAYISFAKEKVLPDRERETLWEKLSTFEKNFKSALKEDLNTPLAISELTDFLKDLYRQAEKGFPAGYKEKVFEVLRSFNSIFKFLKFPKEIKDREILELAKRRDRARREGNFEEADIIREELINRGYKVYDTPSGTRVINFLDEE
ncbi:cysteinyl-tRNA synthetase [Caldimicrobium thiodismutans]|uniref:Cysteine--tRNA ligase n=1 Tax=Caldimicrobium thiodismutans TaxID=1653476 RepID=A0A0U4W303_9BACT|nr:cysteine synthase [Caldimicrobium thiodismutans]BAU23467.1 cysteinyl-tRNA synthetase [Caldimicrobium thiodismutans]